MELYLWIDEQQQGPYSLEQIQAWLAESSLSPEIPAWAEGQDGWQPLNQLLAPTQPAASSVAAVARPGSARPTSARPSAKKPIASAQPQPTTAAPTKSTKTVSIQGTLKRGLAADLQNRRDTEAVATRAQAQVQAQPRQPQPAPAPPRTKAGLIGLILAFFLPFIGIIFSIKAMRERGPKGLAITGLILNILGVLAAIGVAVVLLLQPHLIFGKKDERGNTVGGLFGPKEPTNIEKIHDAVIKFSQFRKGESPTTAEGARIIRQQGLEKDFQYRRVDEKNYNLLEAGPDQKFGTGDDIVSPQVMP